MNSTRDSIGDEERSAVFHSRVNLPLGPIATAIKQLKRRRSRCFGIGSERTLLSEAVSSNKDGAIE